MNPDLERDMDQVIALVEAAASRTTEAGPGAAPLIGMACHVNPDGDALGSMLALKAILEDRGVAAVASFPEPFAVPPHYRFLPRAGTMIPPEKFPESVSVMFTFDCADAARLGELRPVAERAGTLVVIDHHASNDRYGSLNVIDPDTAASGMILYRMAKKAGWPISPDAAVCLYTAIATDTGRFQFSNTTPEVFAAAADLAGRGVPVAEISRTVFEEHRTDFLRFLGRVLGRLDFDEGLSLVTSWYDQADLLEFGVLPEETESVIDFVRQAKEAEVACLVKQTAADDVKVSLRSLGKVDVGGICSALGGGGHRMAAGYTSGHDIPGTIDEIREKLASAAGAGRG